jgi:DNA polymerase-4
MDAFYASVEQLLDPSLREKPVAVGGVGPHAVVSAASYEARAFGIHSAMPMKQAIRLCTDLIVLPVRMDVYEDFSDRIMAILLRYTPEVEPMSLDEAFMDVTGSSLTHGSMIDIARRIKGEINVELGLSASIGGGPNKFIAKVASGLKKPDGLVIVSHDDVKKFLDPLPVEIIPGVGKKTATQLHCLGIYKIEQIRSADKKILEKNLGSYGEVLKDLSYGIDMAKVEPVRHRKSIGHEVTLDDPIHKMQAIIPIFTELCVEVGTSLRSLSLFARCVQVKFRYKDYSLYTRQCMVPAAINTDQEIFSLGHNLIKEHVNFAKGVRLIGVTCSHLSSFAQRGLYADDQKKERLYASIDKIRSRYGIHGVVPGTMGAGGNRRKIKS